MIGHPLSVRELLNEIARGEVMLPEIQRAYVWNGPQVAKLLDSIYNDFPTGQILLWDTQLAPIVKPLEGASADPASPGARPKVVLDGQQRLTSLYQALSPITDSINVYFNIETEKFERYSSRMKADPLWVPVRAVLHNQIHDVEILDAIEGAGGPGLRDERGREYLNRLQRLKRIGDYKYPIELFKSDDYDVVTELFVRINSGGTRLRAAELVLAQLALRLPGALVERFEHALNEYEEVGYDLDSRFLVRALIAVGTGQSRYRYLTEFWKKAPSEIDHIWGATKKGIDAAVNFVRHNARFESSDWLPSIQPLIPLTVYFTEAKRMTGDVERGLLRWFYVASLTGRYSTSVETALDEDLKALRESNPVSALSRNAAGHEGWRGVTAEDLDDAGQRNPLFAMTYAAARKRSATDWFKGVAISTDVVGSDHEIQVHHIFPKALLRDQKVPRRDIDEIANLAFLAAKPNRQISNSPPDQYLTKIASEHRERLEAQCVPLDPDLWRLERYQDFLAARRALLAEAVNRLIEDPR